MKMLSIKQPHADRIMRGVKHYEIRSWHTKYRGPLVICSGKRSDKRFPGAKSLPAGVTIATCDLDAIVPFTEDLADAACVTWRDGLYAWKLANVVPIVQVPVLGKLGLFSPPEGLRCIPI